MTLRRILQLLKITATLAFAAFFAAPPLLAEPPLTSPNFNPQQPPMFGNVPRPHGFRGAGGGIVPVRSQRDGLSGVGTGAYFAKVKYDPKEKYGHGVEKLFLLTASHVSQGEKLEIDDCDFPPLGRLANNDCDIEILQVDPRCGQPIAYVEQESQRILFYADRLEAWTVGKAPWAYSGANYVKLDRTGTNIALLAPWAAPGELAFQRSEKMVEGLAEGRLNFWDQVTRNPLTGELYAPALVSPGQSGAPVASRIPESPERIYRLNGVVEGFQKRHMAGTYICGPDEIEELYRAYQAGKRGHTSKTRWHVTEGQPYRRFSPSVAEIPSLHARSGGYGTGHPGNQGTGRPGNQGTARPGNQGTGRPGTESSFAELPPGGEWGGKHVIALRFGVAANVYADSPALLYALRAEASNTCGPIHGVPLASDFHSLLRDKAGTYLNWLGNVKDAFAVISRDPYVLSVAPAGAGKSANTSTVSVGETMRFAIQGPPPAREKLRFEIDGAGRVRDLAAADSWKPFAPEFTMRGESGAAYLVDLTSFFFVNPHLVRPLPATRPKNTEDACELLRAQGKEGAILRVFDQKTGAVVETRFDRAEALDLPPPAVAGELDPACREYLKSRVSNLQEILDHLQKGKSP